MARVVVVGAGIVGSACAYYLARDGHDVTLVDRGPIGMGTSSRGEGNILISDKAPGAEMDLARWSIRLWRDLASELGTAAIEWEPKGGLVVAQTDCALAGLLAFAGRQRAAGVHGRSVRAGELPGYEPHLATGLAGGVWYPDDQQVQPVRAAAALVRNARALGARVRGGLQVEGIDTGSDGAIRTVECRSRDGVLDLHADAVINAAGTWAGDLAHRFGAPVPVLPRRGIVLVTEPLPRAIRHKVYTADYVSKVTSSDAALETSLVVEGTRGGTILIGASRERVGFDATISQPVVRRLAQQAVDVFPFLRDVSLMRSYAGFRPYCPDHLPVIGPDPRLPGLFHACGHEGAGIGLAPATGALIAAQLSGRPAPIDATPLSPERFSNEVTHRG